MIESISFILHKILVHLLNKKLSIHLYSIIIIFIITLYGTNYLLNKIYSKLIVIIIHQKPAQKGSLTLPLFVPYFNIREIIANYFPCYILFFPLIKVRKENGPFLSDQ